MPKDKGYSYREAGVDIDEADRALRSIRRMAQTTFTRGVLSDIGSFGAFFALPRMQKPVLVSSVDGVGTKLKVAFLAGKHDTVGEDLVNHCVNDVAVQGATPLFFLDYFAVGKLDASVAVAVVSGMVRGCKQNGCALIGGETAEMPGMYAPGEYDLAGTIVGCAEKAELLTGSRIREGDILIALPSTGLHTNGYSLARKILFEEAGFTPDTYVADFGRTVAEELLSVHRSYLKPLAALRKRRLLQGAAHITGGGITENTPRILPKGLAARIDLKSWEIPPLFRYLQAIGHIPPDDYRRTFNLGIGMIFAVAANDVPKAQTLLRRLGEKPMQIGQVAKQKRGRGRVEYI